MPQRHLALLNIRHYAGTLPVRPQGQQAPRPGMMCVLQQQPGGFIPLRTNLAIEPRLAGPAYAPCERDFPLTIARTALDLALLRQHRQLGLVGAYATHALLRFGACQLRLGGMDFGGGLDRPQHQLLRRQRGITGWRLRMAGRRPQCDKPERMPHASLPIASTGSIHHTI